MILNWEPVSRGKAQDVGNYSYNVGIRILSMSQMQQLNKKYGKTTRGMPTDILSFPCQFDEEFCCHINENTTSKHGQDIALGDIFICPEWILKKYHIPPIASYGGKISLKHVAGYRVLLKLLIHGVVHLLGLDHHRTVSETILMRKIEKTTFWHFWEHSRQAKEFRFRYLSPQKQRSHWFYIHRVFN